MKKTVFLLLLCFCLLTEPLFGYRIGLGPLTHLHHASKIKKQEMSELLTQESDLSLEYCQKKKINADEKFVIEMIRSLLIHSSYDYQDRPQFVAKEIIKGAYVLIKDNAAIYKQTLDYMSIREEGEHGSNLPLVKTDYHVPFYIRHSSHNSRYPQITIIHMKHLSSILMGVREVAPGDLRTWFQLERHGHDGALFLHKRKKLPKNINDLTLFGLELQQTVLQYLVQHNARKSVKGLLSSLWEDNIHDIWDFLVLYTMGSIIRGKRYNIGPYGHSPFVEKKDISKALNFALLN